MKMNINICKTSNRTKMLNLNEKKKTNKKQEKCHLREKKRKKENRNMK